jgi:pyruvate dehydrogenase E2 component (dihydrolipoamide acetyltransferase)
MDLKLPHLGEGADSGTVVNLFVKEGDQLTKDQAVLELENEKAVATIPATAAGTVTRIFVKAGEKISVGQRILSLTEAVGTADGAAKKNNGGNQTAKPTSRRSEPEEESEGADDRDSEDNESEKGSGTEPVASPALRKMARDLGLDLSRVRGRERGGRIVLADVRAYVQKLQQSSAKGKSSGSPSSPKPVAAESYDFARWGPIAKRPLTPLRQVIARRMLENWNAIPHVTQFDEVDITELMALRKKYAPAYQQKGAHLTITSFAIKALVEALKKHPVFNSSLDEAAQELVYKEYYHIGVAVDTEAGLMVPVIRDVDKKNLLELSVEIEQIAKKARERKITSEDIKGGSFTISNQGGIGGGHFTPIVNKPEVAILGLGRGANKAMVRDTKIEARLVLPIALSYDHRVIDGGTAARFTMDLLQAFQNLKEEQVKI